MTWEMAIGVGAIIASFVQVCTLVYFGGRLTQKVDDHDRRIEKVEDVIWERTQHVSR